MICFKFIDIFQPSKQLHMKVIELPNGNTTTIRKINRQIHPSVHSLSYLQSLFGNIYAFLLDFSVFELTPTLTLR